MMPSSIYSIDLCAKVYEYVSQMVFDLLCKSQQCTFVVAKSFARKWRVPQVEYVDEHIESLGS